MEDVIRHIVGLLRSKESRLQTDLAQETIQKAVRAANKGNKDVSTHVGKRKLWPFLLKEMRANSTFFKSLNLSQIELKTLEELLTTKPIRTASGVATVTVLTKPFPCSGTCVFCPNDIRMPKSYIHDEPACQRAERLWFDPYLQVYKRLEVLREMGHDTGKVELIVLGGTWTDYPEPYQRWFVKRCFDALNDFGISPDECVDTERAYHEFYLNKNIESFKEQREMLQEEINAHNITYNAAWQRLYQNSSNAPETASWSALTNAQKANEKSSSRCVGLVLETRPDKIDPNALASLRRLGATKIQIGVQSTRNEILENNARESSTDHLEQSFALLRLFGFKIHAHAMVNLIKGTPAADIADYRNLVTNEKYLPDEIKLYPCALVAGTKLELLYKDGVWHPYTTEELVNTLAQDILATPPYARISRMIRDIPSNDILVGNKKTNLRQMVEKSARMRSQSTSQPIQEIRMREIHQRNAPSLGMSVFRYRTNVSDERFIQMTTPDNSLIGFCRLSLPNKEAKVLFPESPAADGSAMIRELHVYGVAVGVGESHSNGQHRGLGTSLLQEAEREAMEAGFKGVRVISAVGTRDYYRMRGYKDAQLYLEKQFDETVCQAVACPNKDTESNWF